MPQQQEKAPEQAYLGFDLSTQKVNEVINVLISIRFSYLGMRTRTEGSFCTSAPPPLLTRHIDEAFQCYWERLNEKSIKNNEILIFFCELNADVLNLLINPPTGHCLELNLTSVCMCICVYGGQ